MRVSPGFGYIRCWNDRARSGFTALGLRPAGPGESAMTINGVVYPIEGHDLSAFDAPEKGYIRIEIPHADIEAVSWQDLPAQGRIWVYIPARPGEAPGVDLPSPDAEYPLLQSYIDVLIEGGLQYGPDFAREIIETTEGWSKYWLNDRPLARRPWVFDRSYKAVDGLLSSYAPHFADRELPEDYAAKVLLPKNAEALFTDQITPCSSRHARRAAPHRQTKGSAVPTRWSATTDGAGGRTPAGSRETAEHARSSCPVPAHLFVRNSRPTASVGLPASEPATVGARAWYIPGAAAHLRRSAAAQGSKIPWERSRSCAHRRMYHAPSGAIAAAGRRRGRSREYRFHAPWSPVPARQPATAPLRTHGRPGVDQAAGRCRHGSGGSRSPTAPAVLRSGESPAPRQATIPRRRSSETTTSASTAGGASSVCNLISGSSGSSYGASTPVKLRICPASAR